LNERYKEYESCDAMKTLVIISHPEIDESSSQQYLLSSVPQTMGEVTIHHLEGRYAENQPIDVEAEQQLLESHDRILFQFPFYWYSSPPLLKRWQDEVLLEGFAYGKRQRKLKGKEFGLVMVVGVPEREYQAGGREGFTISALTTPFQALARKTEMDYMKPLVIFQFPYMKEKERMRLLIRYRQMLTREKKDSLESRENWIVEQLEQTDRQLLGASGDLVMDHALSIIEDNRMTLDELDMLLENM